MKIYLDNNLGVSNVEQEELTQDTIGYNILKVYIPNAVLTPYDTFTCYYGALLQNGRKVGWFAMEARTSSDADYKANYTLYKATLEQCVVSVEGKVYIGCQVLLGNSGNATLIKKNTAVVQFNVRKSVAINNDILVLDTDQTTTDVLESYKNLLENALTTYATKASVYTKTEVNSALALKADKSDTYTKNQVDVKDLNLAAQMASDKLELNNRINTTNNILVETNAKVASLETDVDTLQNNTYSKTEVDEKIDDISAYTKSEIDTMINAKADKTTVEGINTRVGALENDIADLKSVQNVVEVVATKSALNSYDTTKLDANDKVQVIADETHGGASTIYNWNGSAWQYVGAFGGNSYTKAETYNKTQIDSALSDKADKSNTYTRAVIDSMVLTLSTDKADKSNTYTKTEIDNTMQEVGEIVETLGKEVEKKANAEYICKGNTTTQTSYSNTNPSKSGKVKLYKLGGMSYKSDNLINNSPSVFEMGAVSYNIGRTYNENKVSNNARIRTINLISVDSTKTYSLSVPSPYLVIAQGYNNDLQVSSTGTQFNQALPNLSFTGVSQVSIIVRKADNSNFSGINDISNIKLMFYFEGINDSAVTSVVSKGSNNTTIDTLAIPSEIQALTGYGLGINDTCYNYIDFDRKVFVQKVGRVDMGTLDWFISSGIFVTNISDIKPAITSTAVGNLMCANYTSVAWSNIGTDKSICVINTARQVRVNDTEYTKASEFKTAMSGVYLYYELATPIETDISSYISKDTLEVVEGGTLEFLNTYNQAVPNEVAYIFNAVTLNNIVDSNGNTNVIATKQELNEKSKVVANPTLSGNEETLEGAEIDGVKYKVGGGGSLYRHQVHFVLPNSAIGDIVILNNSITPFTFASLIDYLSNYSASNYYISNGLLLDRGTVYNILGVFKYDNTSYPFGIVYSNSLNPQNTGFSTPSTLIDTVTEV